MKSFLIAKNLLLRRTCENCSVVKEVHFTFPKEAKETFVKYNCKCRIVNYSEIAIPRNQTCENWF